MRIDKDERSEFSLSPIDTPIDTQDAVFQHPEFSLLPQTPKPSLLEQLPLNNTTTTTQLIPGMRIKTGTFKNRMVGQWSLKNVYSYIITDPQYKNTLFNIASTFILSVLGFFFWILIARLYTTENVGIATSIISIMTLLSTFTMMGLNASLTRFLPKSLNKDEFITTSFVAVTIVTLLPCVVFLLGLQFFSPHLLFLRSNVLYMLSFIIFIVFSSWNILVDSIFIAFRATSNMLIKNTVISVSKLLLPFALLTFGAYGIFAAAALAITLGVLVGLIILSLKFKVMRSISVNVSLLKKYSTYSLANYVVVFMRSMPSLVLPVILLNVLSAKYAAYFYVASMIQNALLIIPIATEQSLLAEGSYNEVELKKHIKKAISTVVVLLVPATVIIILFGNVLLQLFGKSFASEAFQFLQLYSASTIFTALLLIASAILNIKHKIKTLLIINVLFAVLTLCLSYAFISSKLVGIGWGWLLGQAIAGLVAAYFIIRNYLDTSQLQALPEKVQTVLE